MIVRERSNVSVSPRKGSEWPPKSPLEALLSSPNGRRKYQQRRDGRSVSPSPTKRHISEASAVHGHTALRVSGESKEEQEEEDDDDEETLQLKLQAIEAKLKLKKLQQAKGQHAAPSEASMAPGQEARPHQSSSKVAVQVPVSPSRNHRITAQPSSPARVILGIDKGLNARSVSLKRPVARARAQSPRRDDTESQKNSKWTTASGAGPEAITALPIKSFSERIRESRAADGERLRKVDRIQSARAHGFGFREDGDNKALCSDTIVQNGNLESKLREKLQTISSQPSSATRNLTPPQSALLQRPHKDLPTQSATSATLDAFSGFHLSKRSITHETLTRLLANKELYSLPKILKEVKGPQYEPPDVEGDFVVMGIIASKSSPRDHAKARKITTTNDADDDAKATGRSKFMALRLVDLKWEVDLFLFDTAFKQFWKLTPGTVIAILNPGIMPPKRGSEHTGAFALKLSSSDDTVLEIGTARDLGFCKSIKGDGHECESWVNAKKTEFCDFHVNMKVAKMRANRMEVNGMGRFGNGRKREHDSQGPYIQSRTFKPEPGPSGNDLPRQVSKGRMYDYEARSQFYVIPQAASRSTASILDNSYEGNIFRGMSKEERDKKRDAAQEKEWALADQLAQLGANAGGEYMRLKSNRPARQSSALASGDTLATDGSLGKANAASLGLLGKRATDVVLSSTKRKRIVSSGRPQEPMGWSGAFKRDLLLNTEKPDLPTKERDDASPRKKRTRFMLENKGLRTPGRDSLGVVVNEISGPELDDDDLDIIGGKE